VWDADGDVERLPASVSATSVLREFGATALRESGLKDDQKHLDAGATKCFIELYPGLQTETESES